MITALMLVIIGFWPANKLGSEFMPDLNEGDIMYMPTTFPGISTGKAQELLQQMDKLIRSVPEVRSVFRQDRARRDGYRPGAADHDRDGDPAQA